MVLGENFLFLLLSQTEDRSFCVAAVPLEMTGAQQLHYDRPLVFCYITVFVHVHRKQHLKRKL